jgi:hypothetical protein
MAGARQDSMKFFPFIHAREERIRITGFKQLFSYRIVHAGQHYIEKMSQNLFMQLNIPSTDQTSGVEEGARPHILWHHLKRN